MVFVSADNFWYLGLGAKRRALADRSAREIFSYFAAHLNESSLQSICHCPFVAKVDLRVILTRSHPGEVWSGIGFWAGVNAGAISRDSALETYRFPYIECNAYA